MKIKKILSYFPSYPHYKMNIFSGTNYFIEAKEAVKMLINKDKVVVGDDLFKYKDSLERKFKSKAIYTFASGRMGFYSILKAINIQPNDEVIIPSYTCVVVPNAIIYSEAKPIYCDISDDDFNIDVSKIENLITSKTRVLYAQHTFGQMCDIDKIVEIAKKYNLIVVEDAALSIGAIHNSEYAGTIGDFGYYSTDRSKVINTGLGGIVSVNNTNYIDAFESYYNDIPYLDQAITEKIAKTFILNLLTLHPKVYWFGKFINVVLSKFGFMTYFLDESFIKKENIVNYPYPARLSNVFAKIGISQIKFLDNNIINRKKVAKYYNSILMIYTDDYLNDKKNIFLRYSLLIENRDYWEKKFSSKIDLSIWFKTIISGKSENFEEIDYTMGTNKISEHVCKNIFNLPTHNQIKPEKLRKFLQELKNSGDIITKERIL